MTHYTTVFGSIDDYEKGGVDIINDDPKHYAWCASFDLPGLGISTGGSATLRRHPGAGRGLSKPIG